MDIRQTNYKKGSYGLIIKIIDMNQIVYISENLVNYILFEEKNYNKGNDLHNDRSKIPSPFF